MVATFDKSTGIEDEDRVGRFRCRQSVGDGDRCAARRETFDGAPDLDLECRVDGRGRFVEDEQIRIRDPRADDRDQLPLSRRKVAAALTHAGSDPPGQRLDPVEQLEVGDCYANPIVTNTGPPVPDVVGNGAIEEETLLRNIRHTRPQRFEPNLIQGCVGDCDHTRSRIEQPCGELGKRRLPRSRLAHHGGPFTSGNGGRDIVDHVAPRRVPESDILELNIERAGGQINTLDRISNVDRCVEHVEHLAETGSRRLRLVDRLDKHLDGFDQQRHEEQERDQGSRAEAPGDAKDDTDGNHRCRDDASKQLGR